MPDLKLYPSRFESLAADPMRIRGLGIMSDSRIAMLVALFLAAFLAKKTTIFFAAKNAAFETSRIVNY